MKTEGSCGTPADARKALGALRRILCLFFLVTVVGAVGAVASSLANQGSMKLSKAAPGNIIVVTNTNDNGPGSLRDALAIANDGDTIDATGISGTILLISGQLNVDKDVIISGPGANHLAVDGNASDRVFCINSDKTVTISGLTITNGDTNNGGGGIWNDGALMLSDCTVSGNSGGGIVNSGTNAGAVLTITNSTISDNSGGGIANGAGPGGATVIVVNSTISGNSTDYSGDGISSGCSVGGVSSVTVSNSTLSGNWAAVNGGGIYNARYGTSATVVISNTILDAGNSGENIFNDGGTVTSHGYNVSSDNGGGYLNGPSDQINTDPLLGPLQHNGGSTFTHALLPGSPAINQGDPSFTPPPFYDQRGPGFDRVVNGRIDIGAFEVQLRSTPAPRPRPTPYPRPTS